MGDLAGTAPAWEPRVAPELVASPTAGGSASTEGVWEELGSPLPAPVHLTSGLHFYEWAGGELIPVTMHSGTLTTNLI